MFTFTVTFYFFVYCTFYPFLHRTIVWLTTTNNTSTAKFCFPIIMPSPGFSWFMVGWLHHGRDAHWQDSLPGHWSWVEMFLDNFKIQILKLHILSWLKAIFNGITDSWNIFWVNCQIFSDIDQLTRILALCGTPTQETMDKISSVEVGGLKLNIWSPHIYVYVYK